MTERELGIRVEATYRGRGFEGAADGARELVRNIDALKEELRESEKTFEKAQSNSIHLKAEYKRLAREGEATRDELRALSQQISEAETAELGAINRTRRLIREFEGLEGGTGELDEELRDLNERLQKAEGYVTGVTNKVKHMDQGFKQLDGQLGESNTRLGQVGNKLDDLITKGPHIVAIGSLIADGIQEAADAAVEFGKESHAAFLNFDRQAREIFTLLPGSSAQMRDDLKRDALIMGTELGRLPDEVMPAIYNALSAGIPEDNVLDAVAKASDAARAGVAELDTTLQLGVAILNAQVSGVTTLDEIYDQLFFTIKNGVITMPELTDGLNAVTSIAGEAGVALQDISAALIVMTRQGDSPQEAFELLSIMLTQLSTAGTTLATTFEHAAGVSFRQFIAQGGNLAGAMALLQQHAENTGMALGDMLGGGSPFFRDTQAARGALELTGKHLEDLIYFSEEAQGAMGSMAEAAAVMGESAELGMKGYQAAMAELKIATGEWLDVYAGPLLENATQFARIWSGNRAAEVEATTQAMIAEAQTAEELADALGRVASTAMDTRSGFDSLLVGKEVKQELNQAFFELIPLLAAASESSADFADRLEQAGATVNRERGWARLNGEVIEFQEEFQAAQTQIVRDMAYTEFEEKLLRTTQAQQGLNDALAEQTPVMEPLRNVYDGLTTSEEQLAFAAAMAKENHEEASLAYELTDEYLADLQGRQDMVAEATERHNEAIRLQEEAINRVNNLYSGYAVAATTATEQVTNWRLELFNSADTMNLTQDELILLATATGEFTDAEIENMLRTAAMREAVDLLAKQIAEGSISIEDAVTALDKFEQGLDKDFTARIDTGDVDRAKGEVEKFIGALERVKGPFKAKIEVETGSIPIPTGPNNKGPTMQPTNENAMHSGGRFDAYEPIMVGDGPGGQVLPTTELLMFDRPGYVMNGQQTNALMGASGGGGQSVQVNIHLYGVQEQRVAQEAASQTVAALREIGIGVAA